MSTDRTNKDVRSVVREEYGKIAQQGGSCGGSSSCCGGPSAASVAEVVGYDSAELKYLPEGANMGLSCGNPTALASLREGEILLDLGAGAGLDVFIAARKLGAAGRAIGVDMTPEMVAKARVGIEGFGQKTGLSNVEFRLGEIEYLPVADASVDVVISNCVINLSPDKAQVWREIARVLRPGGRVAVSDLALLRPLPQAIQHSVEALIGCVAGAVLVEETKAMVEAAGLTEAVFEAKSEYVDSMASWSDPLYRAIADQLPPGTKPSDYVTSLSITAVKPSLTLSPKVKELIAIGASITAHCQPCLVHHVGKAREMGISEGEIREAVNMGQKVEKGGITAMRDFTGKLLDSPTEEDSACGAGETRNMKMANLVEVFDPPMCCSSGVCGPKVDKRLVQFSAALEWLRAQDVQVERYNPSHQYEALAGNASVVNAISSRGMECLPLILVDGEIVSYGAYPSKEELAVMAGIQSENGVDA